MHAETGPTPTFSISIEWENSRFADLGRTRRMLRRLRDELLDLPPPTRPPEVLLLYDRFTVDGELVASVVETEFRPSQTPALTRIVATDGLRYYQQKNRGAAETDGDIVIFLDCDVIPEPGWLAALLSSFDDPTVEAAGGETYVELDSLRGKAFALFWFFNLRDPNDSLTRATTFHANNVAFRRELFAANPFPELPAYRAQCVQLGAELCAQGRGLFRQGAARASHPYPRTLGYFAARALHNGRDTVLTDQRNVPAWRRWGSTFGTYVRNVRHSARRIRRHYKDVTLSPPGAAAALTISISYFTLRAIGEATSRVRPNLVARLFPI